MAPFLGRLGNGGGTTAGFGFGRRRIISSNVIIVAPYTGAAAPILNTTDSAGQILSSGVRSDSNASNLILAMPLTTSGGRSYNNDIIPSGRTSPAKTITNYNSGSFSGRYKFYGDALYNSGSSSYMVPSSNILTYGNSFTIECWIYWISGNGAAIYSDSDRGGLLWLNFGVLTDGKLWYYSYPSVSSSSTSSIIANQWNHIAFTKSGSTVSYFINGVKDATTATWSNPGGSASMFPMLDSADHSFQDLRIYDSFVKYTGNFTP
jgi:hypothetical protein